MANDLRINEKKQFFCLFLLFACVIYIYFLVEIKLLVDLILNAFQ